MFIISWDQIGTVPVPLYWTLLILLGKATQSYDISDFQDVDITVGGLTAFTSLLPGATASYLTEPPPPPPALLQWLLPVHLISKRVLSMLVEVIG
jgi:hypothetical protein